MDVKPWKELFHVRIIGGVNLKVLDVRMTALVCDVAFGEFVLHVDRTA